MDSQSLVEFLRTYGDPEPIQQSDQAFCDTQIKNLSLAIAVFINSAAQGTVLDIGCGRGIVLNRLSEIDEFTKQPGWQYVGVDFPENHKDIIELASNVGIDRRVSVISLDDLYNSWVSAELVPRPLLCIIRNVFHELDIEHTALLMASLNARLHISDIVLIQDLQVFPQAERGNVCWVPTYFQAMLEGCGFKCVYVDEPTAKGNRWFTVQAIRNDANPLVTTQIMDIIFQQRTAQYLFWKASESLVPNDLISRNRIARLDYDLQLYALQNQLSATLEKHFNTLHVDAFINSIKPMHRQSLFTYGDHFNEHSENLLIERDYMAVIPDATFNPKSVCVTESLHKRVHDLQITSSVSKLFEINIPSIGCFFSVSIVKPRKHTRFPGMAKFIVELISKLD